MFAGDFVESGLDRRLEVHENEGRRGREENGVSQTFRFAQSGSDWMSTMEATAAYSPIAFSNIPEWAADSNHYAELIANLLQ